MYYNFQFILKSIEEVLFIILLHPHKFYYQLILWESYYFSIFIF